MTRITVRTMTLAALGAAFLMGPLSGCGGGCSGGGEAASILERLPAEAEGVGVLSLRAIFDDATLTKLEAQLLEAGGDKVPAAAKGVLAKIEHVAIVAMGPGEGGGGDCEKAADHAVKVMSKELEGTDPPKSMRAEILKQCERDPSVAACLLDAKTMKDFMHCEPGMGGGRPEMRVAAIVLGEGLVADLDTIAAGAGFKPGDGVPKYKHKRAGGIHPLGDAGVVASADEALLKLVVAAWEGKGPRLDKNAKLWGWLAKVDRGADLVAAMIPPEAVPMVQGGAMSLALGSSFKSKTFLAGDAELASMARQGMAGAKLAMAMVGDEQLAQMTSEIDIPKEEAKKLLEGVKELVDSAELEDSEGGILVTASAGLDVRALVALSADVSSKAFKKYQGRAKEMEDLERTHKAKLEAEVEALDKGE